MAVFISVCKSVIKKVFFYCFVHYLEHNFLQQYMAYRGITSIKEDYYVLHIKNKKDT